MSTNRIPQGTSDALARQQKADRLGQALRENLRRRKSQARARQVNQGDAKSATLVADRAQRSQYD